jgi:hypothetical protein
MKILLSFLLTSTISAFLIAKHPLSVTVHGSGVKYFRLAMKTPSPLDPEEMRESAQRLRKEAAILESRLEERRSNFPKTENQEQRANSSTSVSYSSSLSDSSWTLTYRFSSTPDESTPQQQEVDSYRSSYGGKLTVLFRADGYTDILNHEPIGSRSDIVTISKAWGWDREPMNTNNNDKDQKEDTEYVLFSTNVQLPASDTKFPNEEIRFYWQCQIETDSSGLIRRLVDGTITIKQDIMGPTGGFWGIFNGRGILAQFRYVGNFAAQPYSPKEL